MANFSSRDQVTDRRNGNGRPRNQPMDADTMSQLATRGFLASAAADDDWGTPGAAEPDLEAVSDEESKRILAATFGNDGAKNANREKIERLRAENEQLQALIAELRQQVDEAVGNTQETFAKREEEFEALLEEKSEELRTLFIRIQQTERERAGAAAAHAASPAGRMDEERVSVWADIQREHAALEQERQRLEEERRQLREDEESMMQRMREMELQVAKSRTDMVRQRNEMQQLHNEVRAELEKAQQTGTSLDRVRSLRQQHQDVANRRAGR